MAVYPWLTIDTEDQLWGELNQRTAQQQALQASVTRQQADIASGLADAYPWLDSGVVQSLTIAGQGYGSPTAQMVAEAAGQVGVDDGLFEEPASNVPDNQFDGLWDMISTNVGRGLLNMGRGAIAVLAAPFEEAFERVAPAIEGADLATDPRFEGDLGDNVVADVLEVPGNIAGSLSKLTRGEFWGTFWDNLTTKASPSTLALAVGDIADPNRSPALFGYDRERGQGLIANFERRQQFRNRITIPGVGPTAEDPTAGAATLGRSIARSITEPGSEPYKLLSGAADFWANVAVPVGVAPRGTVAGLRLATGTANRSQIIAAGGRAGLLPGITKGVDLDDAVNGFLTSRQGQRMVDWFANETDHLRIWERTGHNNTVARELVEANDQAAVIDVFQRNLGLEIREVPTAGPVGSRVGDVVGGEYGRIFGPGAVVRRSTSNLRWTHDMPNKPLNPHDMNETAETVHDFIRTARLGDERASHYLSRIAELSDGEAPALYRIVVNDLYAETLGSLTNRGPTPLSRPMSNIEARRLTRAWSEDVDQSRAFFINAAGENADLSPARNIIGGEIHDMKPVAHLASERLANSIPLPEISEIKRAASFYNRVWDVPGVKDSVALADFVLGTAWKSMQLVTRLAYPVRVIGEEQVRLAGVGMNSAFRHPVDYLSWVVGTTGDGPVSRALRSGLGEQGSRTALGDVFTEIDEFQGAMSRGSSVVAGGQAVPGHILTGQFGRVDKTSTQYFDGATVELQQLAADPIAQKIAGGLKPGEARALGLAADDPNAASIDVIKEWFYSGQGQRFRKDLAEDPNWRRLIEGDDVAGTTARQEADAYIDSVAERINIKTGQNPDLVQAVATGKLGDVAVVGQRAMGKEAKIAKALEAYEDSLPEFVKVQKVAADRSRVGAATDVWNRAVDRMFSSLMSVPTNNLSRSPHFRQSYWGRMEELMGYADANTQEAIIRGAREAGLSETRQLDLARIATGQQAGEFDRAARLTSVEDADVIARAHALETTRDTLYDLAKRNQFFDSFRLVFPFGEAWKEIFTAWSKIIGHNPAMLRRFQQTVQGGMGPGFGDLTSEYLGTGGLPGQGFFYEEDGTMFFNYPGSELASKLLLEDGAQVAFRGELAGLNLFTATVLPGIGPAVQVPAAVFTEIMKVEVPDGLHNTIFPFGTPPVEEGFGATFWDTFAPSWMGKIETALKDPDSHRLLANTTFDVMRALVRSGEYNTNSQEEIDRLYDAAVSRARLLFWIRGLAQSTAPTGPGVTWSAEDTQGNVVPLQWMTDEYFRIADETGDYDRAGDEFLRRFGIENLMALQGKTRELVPRPLSAEGRGWIDEHEELERRLAGGKDQSLTIGLLAPDPVGGEFDFDAYHETLREGTREQLTPREMVALSNQYKGRIAYENLKSQVEGRTDAQAALWLAQGKAVLAEEYPGFDDELLLSAKAPVEDFIAEFQVALQDPDLEGNRAVEGVRLYMEARAAAQQVVNDNQSRLNGSKGFTSSQSTQFLREWLRAAAEEITSQYPEFGPSWQHVFQRELKED